MTTFRISNPTSGLDMGTFEARDATDALDVMAREAGYEDWRDSCEALGVGTGDAGLRVTEMDAGRAKLLDYNTAETIREATEQEALASREQAERDGCAGVIEVDGRRCYVEVCEEVPANDKAPALRLRGDARVIVANVAGEERALLAVDELPEAHLYEALQVVEPDGPVTRVYGAEDWADTCATGFGFDGDALRQHDGERFYGRSFEIVPCPSVEAEALLRSTWPDQDGIWVEVAT